MTKASPILPGATIGVLGSGQLGRMLAMAARRLGYRVHTFSPETDTPTGQIADVEVTASYDDLTRVEAFAREVDVVTFEFENVPAAAAETCARFAPVRPDGRVLHTAQHRLREKTWLKSSGFPVADFLLPKSKDEMLAGWRRFGNAAVLKTAGFGYDGKGQRVVRSEADADAAWRDLGAGETVLESFVPFEKEVSIIAARGMDGDFQAFPLAENAHAHHILDVTSVPAAVPPATAQEALDIARALFEKLDVVGLLCIEFFVTKDGKLLINELAPRPHNSGHYTIDACATSQFEQQLRAVCGLPLGSPALLKPAAAMANLLGDLWTDGEPDWRAALTFPDVKLHLYGKLDARPGRKMGHITALAGTPAQAAERVRAARAALRPAGVRTQR